MSISTEVRSGVEGVMAQVERTHADLLALYLRAMTESKRLPQVGPLERGRRLDDQVAYAVGKLTDAREALRELLFKDSCGLYGDTRETESA
jgi:hypothetical protein